MKRYLPDRPFPPYKFLPGKHPHPNKEGGYRFQEKEPECSPIEKYDPLTNEDYLYSLDLFNHGYYWEAHVWWEAMWNAHNRQGPMADLLKGLIKLAAAGVKEELGQTEASRGHQDRALELLVTALNQLPEDLPIGPELDLKNYIKKVHGNNDIPLI